MEVTVKNALMYHGNNILELSLSDPKKFGVYAPAVTIMLNIIKAVVNGIKNDTDPDVLFNSVSVIVENEEQSKIDSLEETIKSFGEIFVKSLTERDEILLKELKTIALNIESIAEQVGSTHAQIVKHVIKEQTNG